MQPEQGGVHGASLFVLTVSRKQRQGHMALLHPGYFMKFH